MNPENNLSESEQDPVDRDMTPEEIEEAKKHAEFVKTKTTEKKEGK